jgi:hypothetical protein
MYTTATILGQYCLKYEVLYTFGALPGRYGVTFIVIDMSRRIGFPFVVVVTLIAAGSLTGCSAGALPGGSLGGSPSPTPTRTFAPGTSGSADAKGKPCKAEGSAIPLGSYSGDITATLNTAMQLTVPGAGTLSNAGSGTEDMDGVVHIVSNGQTVTGLIALGGEGTSQVGDTFVIHSKDEGDFTGQISGSASNPIVTGKMGGAWQTLDAPIQSGGSDSSTTTVGLHVTSASCGAVSGDVIAMFSDIAKPVEQYITVSGTGAWTAKRH